MNGILNILKPPGMTSHDVVSFVRRLYSLKKVGHAGTLDPAAAGVLPVFLGQATRLIEYTTDAAKSYRAEVTFGYETDTGDDTGRILRTSNVASPGLEQIKEVLSSFIGSITQIPPMYSAIKTGGKKLYELARDGIAVEVPSRQVIIYDIRLLCVANDKILIDVDCSKGTYIRTLCQDIGRRLGCLATMSFLIRTRVGKFTLQQATSLEETAEGKQAVLLPMDHAVSHIPLIHVDEVQAKAFQQGKMLYHFPAGQAGLVRLYDRDELLLGIGFTNQSGAIKPVKVLSSLSNQPDG